MNEIVLYLSLEKNLYLYWSIKVVDPSSRHINGPYNDQKDLSTHYFCIIYSFTQYLCQKVIGTVHHLCYFMKPK